MRVSTLVVFILGLFMAVSVQARQDEQSQLEQEKSFQDICEDLEGKFLPQQQAFKVRMTANYSCQLFDSDEIEWTWELASEKFNKNTCSSPVTAREFGFWPFSSGIYVSCEDSIFN